LEKSLEKVKKRLKKYSQKILQVVQVKKKEKKFGTSLLVCKGEFTWQGNSA